MGVKKGIALAQKRVEVAATFCGIMACADESTSATQGAAIDALGMIGASQRIAYRALGGINPFDATSLQWAEAEAYLRDAGPIVKALALVKEWDLGRR